MSQCFVSLVLRDTSIKAKKKPAKKSKKGKEDEEDEEDEEEEEVEEEEVAEEEGVLAPEYARKSGKHKGSNAGLKAFVIAQVTGIVAASGGAKGAKLPSAIKVGSGWFVSPGDDVWGRSELYKTSPRSSPSSSLLCACLCSQRPIAFRSKVLA